MVKQTIDRTFRQTNLTNESEDYLRKREEVRLAEIELMRARERVAELRRALPKGATIEDYEFFDCTLPIEHPTRDARAGTPLGRVSVGAASLADGDEPVTKVRLSELFTSPDRSLVIYHFMFGKKQTTACPMCTAWIDGYNGVAPHIAQTTDFAIAAAADPATLRAYGRERGWDKLRLLSAGDSTFKSDLGSEDKEGQQDSQISVFTKDTDGTLRHFYSGHPWLDPEIKERGIDELTPIWNILDLTPQGRGKFYTSLDYGTKVQVARR
jgi:predicted dithiol-disulfide oxidoreductase (DUF899 family)